MNDWDQAAARLKELLPGIVKVSVSSGGDRIALDFKELRKDPTPLKTITSTYLQLAVEQRAKAKRDDPWPVIVIDEANALTEWEDKKSLRALLKFFVFLTKEKQLAHGASFRGSLPCAVQPHHSIPLRSRSDPCNERLISAPVAGKGHVHAYWLLCGFLTHRFPFLQGRSGPISAANTCWATCRAQRLASSSSTASSPPSPQPRVARVMRGSACMRSAEATQACSESARRRRAAPTGLKVRELSSTPIHVRCH